MLSENAVGPSPREIPHDGGEVVAFYICAGLREMPAGFTLFPDGGEVNDMELCPARDICAWYAAHDLGGNLAINEQPDNRLLPVEFKSGPFSCPHFRDYERLLKLRKSARKCGCGCARRRPAAIAAAGS